MAIMKNEWKIFLTDIVKYIRKKDIWGKKEKPSAKTERIRDISILTEGF